MQPSVWRVNGAGTPTHIADVLGASEIEGPAVAPLSFGPVGGLVLTADEQRGSLHAIKNDGTVTLDVISHLGAESARSSLSIRAPSAIPRAAPTSRR